MSKFRKKQLIIEAITFVELVEYGRREGVPTSGPNNMPWSFNYAGHPITHENDACYLVPTLESGKGGFHRMTPQDMLITGVQGEIYPCKLDIFAESYEPVT